jgi:hypothetical protein
MKATTMRRMYLREATIILVVARLAVRLLPANLVIAWAARSPKRVRRFSGYEIDWVAWAVETAGEKKWIRAVCLPRALAAQIMLRRRGIASEFCLGVARNGASLIAHAWVEIGLRVVVGGEGRHRFAKLPELRRAGPRKASPGI